MRVLLGILITLAIGYQLFYRYEYWPSKTQDGVIFERDSLSGVTRQMKPGEKTDWLARLTGHSVDPGNGSLLQSLETHHADALGPVDEPVNMTMIEDAHPVVAGKEVIVASSAPPVPDAELTGKPFSVRTIDLNLDGAREEIIQSANANDGLLDISIVRNGQELLFARGKQFAVMETRSGGGWADVVVKSGGANAQVYRYNARLGGYELFKG